MIESLLRSESRLLAFFALCTYLCGYFVTALIGSSHANISSASITSVNVSPHSLEINTAALASHISHQVAGLVLISALVLAIAYIKESKGYTPGTVRIFARILCLLSVIAMVSAVSTAVFFGICKL
jgi:hypothetical protein